MAAHLRACGQLDRSIRQESQSRTIFDPEMRRLRGALRAECEAALLADYRLAVKHDVEQLLWKAVFYRPIEEFRRRIKQGQGELKAKTEVAFQAYLQDAQAFYLQLAAKLQQRYGDAGFPLALAAQHLAALGQDMAAAEAADEAPDCRASVQRCLVCLGDLARYGVAAAPAAERDWAGCRHFYLLASRAYPEGGNAYNQLAVLSSYEGDDLAATFYYCRALAAAEPFPVARENLVTHLDQNRAACTALASGGGGGRAMRPASQALQELRGRCTRALGMLLTRSELDAFPQQLDAVLADLDDHLQRVRQQGRKAAAAAAAADPPPPLLQLVAAAIYAVHAASAASTPQPQQPQERGVAGQPCAAVGASGGGAAGFCAAVQQRRTHSLALELLFAAAARIAEAAAAALAVAAPAAALAGASGLLLLPPLRVLLQWLAGAGSDALVPAPPPPGGRPAAAGEPEGLTAARQAFWLAAAGLLATLRRLTAPAAEAASQDPTLAVLPEEAQLAGFRHVTPTLPSGSGAAAAAPAPPDSPAVAAARLRRMLADGAAVAAALRAAGSTPPSLVDAHAAFVSAAAAEPEEADDGRDDVDMADAHPAQAAQQQQQQQRQAAVAGSVLPEDDQQPSSVPQPQQPAAAVAPPQPAQEQQGRQGDGGEPSGLQLPSDFFSLLAPQAAAPAEQRQQAWTPLGAPGPPATAAAGQQQRPALGLRALLFGGGGLQPRFAQQQQPTSLPSPSQQPAGTAGAGSAASGALLSSSTPADRWGWLGAFGGAPAADGPGATPAAAPQQQQPQAGLPRTDNPFVP